MSKNALAPTLALVWVLAACSALPWAEGGDDRYRFTPGAGEERTLTLLAADGAVRWSWSKPARAWDTALLGVRVDAGDEAAPWVELSAGPARAELYLDPGAEGLRWLNLTRLRDQLADGAPVEIRGHGVTLEPGAATLRLFENRLPLGAPILVLAPHPDDAEIAAFGLYAGRNATIVTITSGNAGDANYLDRFPDPAEHYRFKGYLRTVDSVTVPWQGGIPPERCFNLGYFDARLATMHGKPKEVVPEMYGPNTDISVYRRANIGRLLDRGPRPSTWANLVDDLATLLRKVKPEIVVMPYPQLDTHLDHQFTTVAAVEALERVKASPRFLLYTNHAFQNLYPFGPAGTGMSLPPFSEAELPVEGVYSHGVGADLQRRQLFALETMHDLRLSPAEQAACGTPGAVKRRDDYPRVPEVDYFRRGPRAEEVFFVFGREGVRSLVRSFLAKGPAR
jgi:LmbE family N-acetylglucosaminyl deacetylase